jgi:hypothetical protein
LKRKPAVTTFSSGATTTSGLTSAIRRSFAPCPSSRPVSPDPSRRAATEESGSMISSTNDAVGVTRTM